MLNRRILRVKAMQNLYAFQQSKISVFHVANNMISERFTPDWDTEELVAEKMKLDKKEAQAIFKTTYNKEATIIADEVNTEVKNAIVDAKNFYSQQMDKDFRHFRENISRYTHNVYYLYLLLLKLLVEITEIISNEWQEKQRKTASRDNTQVQSKSELNLVLNNVIQTLKTNEALNNEMKQYQVSWQSKLDILRHWYKDRLKADEKYQQYLKKSNPGQEQDAEIANHILRKLVLKDDILTPWFEEIDICWNEDRKVVKSMLSKTLKSVEAGDGELELAVLSPNWEEDLAYCKELYTQTVLNEKINEELLQQRIKNWEIDRIASIDYILLQMAISEMVFFPNIPIKVTINEFIEISKNYSTPKSKTFINGVLDVIANKLTQEGKIRKSGRGLIDNK